MNWLRLWNYLTLKSEYIGTAHITKVSELRKSEFEFLTFYSSAELPKKLKEIISKLVTKSATHQFHEILLANGMFMWNDFSIKNPYSELVKQHYESVVQNLDFGGNQQEATDIINKNAEFFWFFVYYFQRHPHLWFGSKKISSVTCPVYQCWEMISSTHSRFPVSSCEKVRKFAYDKLTHKIQTWEVTLNKIMLKVNRINQFEFLLWKLKIRVKISDKSNEKFDPCFVW